MTKNKKSLALLFFGSLFLGFGSHSTDAAEPNYEKKLEQVEYNWGKGGPNGYTDRFNATFDQSQFLSSGDYFIQTLADDGVTVDVNGSRVIDRLNYSQPLLNRAILKNVKEGQQEIITNYKEGTGSAVVFSHVVPFNSWLGYYYANTSFSGTPIASKIIDSTGNGSLVETNWARSPIPGKIPVDNFSAIYYSSQRIKAGDYVLRAGADDGLQVYIDGKLVLDRFTPIGYREDAVKISIKNNGQDDIHMIEVRYKEGILSSRLNVSLQPYSEVMDNSAEDGWVGEVFSKDNLSGKSIILGGKGANQLLENLDLNWKSGSPNTIIPNDYFSARFKKEVILDSTGIYTFKVWADDKVKVYVDGKIVIDSWKYIPGSYREITLPIVKGKHEIKIEYQEAIKNARLKFDMVKKQVDFKKQQTALHYNWGLGSPISKVDQFTAQFDQSQYLAAGDYFVQTVADDGILVDFNGRAIIDRWNYSSDTTNRALLTGVTSGNQNITTLYREGSKSATLFSDIVRFGDWLAYYYPNDNFAGQPKAVKTIKSAGQGVGLKELNWQESPVPSVIPKDHFTAKYVTAQRIPAGEYVLRAGADDGLQVYIDGKLVLDRFTPIGYREDAVKVKVNNTKENEDIHWIEVKYKEGILSSRLNLSLQPYSEVLNPSLEDGWVGELFSNVQLSGNPVILGGKGAAAPINELDFNWSNNAPSPFIPQDYFSARFTGKVNVAESGYYVVKTTADDGVRVYIDGQMVIDSWKYQSTSERKTGVNLTAGDHKVVVEYYDGKLGAKVNFKLEKGKDTYRSTEKVLRYNWGTGSPDVEVQPDHFTAIYDQSQYLTAGDYFMQTLADDGVQIDFNGKNVIDRKSYSHDSLIDRVLLTNLSAGTHKIITNYYEGISNAVLYSEIVKFGDWLAYYYPNETLAGTPIAAKVIKAGSPYGKLSENNGSNSPVPGVVDADYFSAQYVTAKRLPAGEYILRAGADDGIQVYLDGELVIDRFTNGSFKEDSIKINVNNRDGKDIHWIEVRYKEASQASRVEVFLQPYNEAMVTAESDGWFGEFYQNTSLTGPSAIIGGKNALKKVNDLNFNWGTESPSPIIPNDNFSARFTKMINIDSDGDYALTVDADDGVRVLVDGKVKIDSWEYASPTARQVILNNLSAGAHKIVVEYYDGKLGARIKFDLEKVTVGSFLELDLRKPSNITAKDIVDFFNRKNPTSILKNYAQDFIDVQNASGVNAQYLVAHAIWETGWGSSSLSIYKRNFFGYGAYDSCPFTCAYYFPTGFDSISYVAYQVKNDYLTPGGKYYNGATLTGMNVRYATDQNWKNGIANLMQSIKPFDPVYYDKKSANTVSPKNPGTYSRDIPAGQPIPDHIMIDFDAGVKATVKENLKFRSLPYISPGTEIGQIPASTVIEVLGYNTDVRGNWYRVRFNGKTGWVSGDYLTIHNLPKK